jgi:hypothetical protein
MVAITLRRRREERSKRTDVLIFLGAVVLAGATFVVLVLFLSRKMNQASVTSADMAPERRDAAPRVRRTGGRSVGLPAPSPLATVTG